MPLGSSLSKRSTSKRRGDVRWFCARVHRCEVDFFSRKAFHNDLLIQTPLAPERSHIRGIGMATRRRQYRSRIKIAADILEIAKTGSRKTKIMYLGNLSFDLLQKYLDMLVKFSLLEVHGDSEKNYVATEKGKQFLADYRELQKYSEMAESKKHALETSLTIKA
jgi:predicted transcriptional regulator